MEESHLTVNISKILYNRDHSIPNKHIETNEIPTGMVHEIETMSGPFLGFVFEYDDILVSNVNDINPQKLYYKPYDEVRVDEYELTDFRKSFDFYNFWAPTYITQNGISFKSNGEWFTFLTNAEYVLQSQVGFDSYKCHIYFNNTRENNFYKIVKGKYKTKTTSPIRLPKPDWVSNEIVDYFIMDNYRFMDDQCGFPLKEEKKRLNKILEGLDYYYIGTSILDHAKDIDIYVNESDYSEAAKRLLKSGYTKNPFSYAFTGSIFRPDDESKPKLDLVYSPYSKFPEPKDSDHNANPLFMYFLQGILYCSISHDNLSPLYKAWRFNKVLETKQTFGIDNHQYESTRFMNAIFDNDRFDVYFDLLNDNDYTIVNDQVEIGLNGDHLHIKKDGNEYIIVKSKYLDQVIYVNLPFRISDMNVLDLSEDCKNISSENFESSSQLVFNGINDFSLVQFSRMNE